MIDMSLLPKGFRKGWIAVCAQMEDAAMSIRATLEMGDLLMPITPSMSLSCLPGPEAKESLERELLAWRKRNSLLIGRDISVADLYPDAWDTWEWASQMGRLDLPDKVRDEDRDEDWHPEPTYPMTPVDCLISELRDMFFPEGVLTRHAFEWRIAQFREEVA